MKKLFEKVDPNYFALGLFLLFAIGLTIIPMVVALRTHAPPMPTHTQS